MNRALLVERAVTGGKGRCHVQHARFIIPADCNAHVRFTHRRAHSWGERGLGVFLWVAGEQGTPNTQVQHERRRRAQIDSKHGRKRRTLCSEPIAHASTGADRLEPASIPHRCGGKRKRNTRQAGERATQCLLTHTEIRVVRTRSLLMCGQHGARAETQHAESEQRRHVVFTHRARAMIPPRHLIQHGQRVRRVKHRVCCRDGEVANRVAVEHIAEINDTRHALLLVMQRLAAAHEHIEIVQITMNDTLCQRRQQRCGVHVETLYERVDRAAELRVGDERAMVIDYVASTREVPVKLAVQRFVVETGECTCQLGDRLTEVAPKRWRTVRGVPQCDAWHDGYPPREMRTPCRLNLHQHSAIGG